MALKLKKVSLKELAELSSGSKREKVMRLDDVFSFGKYKGKTLKEVAETNMGYVSWCVEKGIFQIDQDDFDVED